MKQGKSLKSIREQKYPAVTQKTGENSVATLMKVTETTDQFILYPVLVASFYIK